MSRLKRLRQKYDKAANRGSRVEKIKLGTIEKFLGSGFGTGFIPFASGTWGSLAALLFYFIPGFEKLYVILPAIGIFSIYGIHVGNRFEEAYGKDPAECTIDEVVGMWITMIALPKAPFPIILSFFIWRFFDIIKVPPAKNIESLKGGWGIMLDDIVSAIYALVLVQGILYVWEKYVLINISGWQL